MTREREPFTAFYHRDNRSRTGWFETDDPTMAAGMGKEVWECQVVPIRRVPTNG